MCGYFLIQLAQNEQHKEATVLGRGNCAHFSPFFSTYKCLEGKHSVEQKNFAKSFFRFLAGEYVCVGRWRSFVRPVLEIIERGQFWGYFS